MDHFKICIRFLEVDKYATTKVKVVEGCPQRIPPLDFLHHLGGTVIILLFSPVEGVGVVLLFNNWRRSTAFIFDKYAFFR